MKSNLATKPRLGRGKPRPPHAVAATGGDDNFGDRYLALLARLKDLAHIMFLHRKRATDPAEVRRWKRVRVELSVAAWCLAQFNLSPDADFLISAAASSLEYSEAKIDTLLSGAKTETQNRSSQDAARTVPSESPFSQNYYG